MYMPTFNKKRQQETSFSDDNDALSSPLFPTITIVDDDDPPPVRLVLADPEISENGGSTTVTARLDWPSEEPTTVDVAVAANSGSGAAPARMVRTRLTIPALASEAVRPVHIVAVNNGVDAPDATVTVTGTVRNSLGFVAPGPVTLTIRDDEPTAAVRLTLSPPEVREAGGVSRVTAALDRPAGEATTVTVTAAAVAPAAAGDFTLSANRVLSIAAGQTASTGTVTVTAADNSVAAPYKQVQVGATVSGGHGVAAPQPVPLTIRDDETAPALTLALSDSTISENGGAAGVTAALEYAAGADTTVTVTAQAVAPAAAGDFTLSANRVLSIAAGRTASTGTVTVTATDNALVAPHKQVRVAATVSGGGGVAAPPPRTLVIEDDEAAPVLAVVLSPKAIDEAGGTSRVWVTHDPAPGVQRTVTVSAAAMAPAVAGDFTLSGATLTFRAGSRTSDGELTIAAVDNEVYARDKRVTVTAAANGFRVARPATGTLTIEDDEETLGVSLELSAQAISEQGGAALVTAMLDNVVEQEVVVTVTATPLAPAAAADFTQAGTRLTIAAGVKVSSGTVRIAAVDNGLDAPDKRVRIAATVGGAALAPPDPVTLTIRDDDAAPAVSLELSRNRIGESGGATVVTARLDRASSEATTVTVSASTEVAPGADLFRLSADPTLTIAAGRTTGSGKVTITALGDEVDRRDRTVRVAGAAHNLHGVTAPSPVQFTIVDDETTPTLTLDLSDDDVDESGGSATVTVRLSGASGKDTWATIVATAVNPAVPAGFALSADPVLTIAAGDTTHTGSLTIAAVASATYTGDRDVLVTGVVRGGIGVAAPEPRTLTIREAQTAPLVALALSKAAIDEDDGSARVTASVTGAAPGGELTLTVTATPDSPATAGDFRQSGTILTIAAGASASTGTVTVAALDDDVRESDETLQVAAQVRGLPGLTAPPARTLTITDDESNPVLTLALSPAVVGENGGVSVVSAALNVALEEDTALTIATTPVTAGTGDFTVSTNRALTIRAGEKESLGLVSITAVDDDADEPAETVRVSAAVSGGLGVAAPAARLLTIVEGEATPGLTLVLDPTQIDENGGTSRVKARLAHLSGEETTVKIVAAALDPPSGAYFTLSTERMLTIAAGATESTGTVTITAVDDTTEGPRKLVRVDGTMVSGGLGVAAPAARVLTIDDNDGTPVLRLALSARTISERDGETTVTASLNGVTAEATTAWVTVTPISPAVAADVRLSDHVVLTIAAGATASTGTVKISGVDNALDGPHKRAWVGAMVSGGNGVADPAPVELTIEDDEAPPIATLALSANPIGENGGATIVSASLAYATSEATVLTVAAAALQPPGGTHFTQAGTTLTIAAGQTASTGTVKITANNDDLDTPDKTVRVAATASGGNGVADPASVTLTIEDGDPTPELTLELSAATIAESGGQAAVTARLSHGSSQGTLATVVVTPTAPAASADFSLSDTRVLTIAAGHTASTGEVSITAVDNGVDAPDKRLSVAATVTGGSGVAAPVPLPLTIRDDDGTPKVTLVPDPASIGEDGGVSGVTATLDRASSVDTTVTVTARALQPPAGSYFTQTGTTLTIAAGATASTGSVTIAAVDDNVVGPAFKVVQLTGVAASSRAVSGPSAVELSITDDELTKQGQGPIRSLQLVLTPGQVIENGGVSTVTATLARPNSQTAVLTVQASAKSPATGSYFVQSGTKLTIAALQTTSTGTVTIAAVDDAVRTPDKTVLVAATVTGGNGVPAPPDQDLIIVDDEGRPTVTLVVAPSVIAEHSGVAEVTARLDHPADEATTVTVAAAPVAPAGAADFAVSASRVLTIAAGATTSTGTLTITAAGNSVDAPDKQVEVTGAVTGGRGARAPGAERLTISDDDPTPSVTLALGADEIKEQAGSTTVTATLSGASSHDTTVSITATGDLPAGSGYFTQTGTLLTIAAGSTASTGTVTIAAVADTVDGPERKRVRVAGDAANAHGVDDPADLILEIPDDDELPAVELVLDPATIGENGGESRVTARLTPPSSAAVTLTVSAARLDPTDGEYFKQTGRTLTIAAGQTVSTGQVTVTAVDDRVDSADKQVRVTAQAAGGNGVAAPAPQDLKITDDEALPVLTLVLGPAVIGENGGASRITARLAHPSSAAVTLTVAASPQAPAVAGDFSLSDNRALTVAAGTTTSTGTVTIAAVNDALDGPDKIVQVTATVAGGRGVQAPAAERLTITDDDGTAVVTLVVTPAKIGENGGVSRVTATLSSAASVATTLQVAVTPAPPAVTGDYSLSGNRTLTIAAGSTGSTGTLTVTAADNAVDAPDKTLGVTAALAGVQGMAAPAPQALTITDDEGPPVVTLVLSPDEIAEAGGVSRVTATLSGASSADTTVRVRAAQVGTPAAEYFTLSATPVLTIAAGATASSGTVTITSIDDTVDGPDKKVRVTGETVNTQGVTAPAPAELTISDDEAAPGVTLVLLPSAIDEDGGVARLTARLGHPSSADTTLTVALTPAAPAVAGDVELTAGAVLNIEAGATESTETVTITAVNNTVDTPDKTVQVGATVTGGNGVAAPASLPLTIRDDDGTPSVTLVVDPATIDEDGGVSEVTATLDHASSADTTVTVTARALKPPAGSYFTQTGTTLTIAAGATASTGSVTVAAVDDEVVGPAVKRVQISGVAAGERTVTDPSAVELSIDDDELQRQGTRNSLELVLTPGQILESAGVSTVTATMRRANSETAVLTVQASAKSPASGSYFVQSGTKLTIAALQTTSTGTVTVTAVDDALPAPNKTVLVAATVTGGNGVPAPADWDLVISDDDAKPVVTLLLSASSVAENGDPVTVTATLSGAMGTGTTLTVAAAAHDPAAGDYFTQTGTKLTIAAGETASTGTVTIAPADDDVHAPDRTVRVAADVAGDWLDDPAAQELTITDDEALPTVTLALSERSVLENEGPVLVTAALSGKTSEDTALTVTATAHDPAAGDYFTQTGTSLTIAAGQTASTGAVSIAPTDDGIDGPDKTVQVAATATGGNGVAQPQAVQVRILDDEGLPRARFELSNDSISENGGASEVTAVLSHPSSEAIGVTIAVAAPGQSADDDYTVDGDLGQTIQAGATATAALTITWVDNDVDEPDRTVTFTGDVDADGTTVFVIAPRALTVRDDDGTPRVTLALSTDTIAESGGSTAVTATLERASSEQTTVTVMVAPAHPAVAADFTLSADPVLTIAAGATEGSDTVTITAIDNLVDAADKTVNVGGEAANTQGVRHPEEVALTITDDDGTPAFGDAETRSVAENTAPGEAIGEPFAASDPDGDTLSYHLGEEEDAAAFLIVGDTGQLVTLAPLDYEDRDTYTFTVQARDGGGNGAVVAVTVQVIDVDEPPHAPAAPTVTPVSLTSLHATWTPPVNPGPPITDYDYRYRVSDPQGNWTEVTDGALTALEVTIPSLGENTSYDVQVRATNDEGTGAWSESGTGRTEGNAWPVFTPESAAFSVPENQPRVGSVAASDADEQDSITGYAFADSVDQALFHLDAASGVLSFSAPPDFEHPRDAASSDPANLAGDNEYVLVVSAISGAGARERTTTRTVVVTVTDLGEPPGPPDTDVTPASTTSLRVEWTPPSNAGPPVEGYDYRYRTVTPPPAPSVASGRSRALATAVGPRTAESWIEVTDTEITGLGVMIDGLSQGTWYEVQVRARNAEGYGPWSTADFASTITPPPPRPPPRQENAGPVFAPTEFSVPENDTEVGTVSATDSDDEDSITGYAIAGGVDQAHFAIDAATGALAFREPPNYEEPRDALSAKPKDPAGDNVYVLMVSATSGMGNRERTTKQVARVEVEDVDEPPAAPDAPAVTGISASRLQVTWTEPENHGPPIDDYDYRYRTHDLPGSWTEVTDSTITELEVTIDDLAAATSYDVQVRASNAEGIGPWSQSGTGATLEPLWNHVVIPWLARFARTATGHVLAGVEERFGDAAAGSQATVAGRPLTAGGEPANSVGDPRLFLERPDFRTVQFRELLAGSSFDLASPPPAAAESETDHGRWALWGRGDWSRFSGVEPALTLDGSVITGTLGADYAHGRVLAGVALAYSSGTGSFRGDGDDSGDLTGTLLSVHPYLRLTLQERLAVWGLLGFGVLGEVGLDPADAPAFAADFGLLMGVFGVQGTLLPARPGGGLELTTRADGLVLSATVAEATGLVRGQAEVIRVRLLLEAGYRDVLLFGGTLSPALEVGVRADEGDAEQGAGLVLGGSVDYSLPAWGLVLSAGGQALLLHVEAGFQEWSIGGAVRFDPGAKRVLT